MKKVETTSAQAKEVKPMPEITLPKLEELLAAGCHFGHKKSAWNPQMRPFIFEERNGVHIIDLVKTLSKTKHALRAIQQAASEGNIMIVGTKGQAATMVQQMALQKGAFFINKRWPGGMFTNFKGVKRSVDNLVKMENIIAAGAQGMVKKEELMMKRDVERLNKVYEGIKFMDKLPSLVIVIDSKVEKIAIRESMNVGVPVVALMDTNCDPTDVAFPIPANDDSLKSISLFVELFGKALDGSKHSASLIATRTAHVTSLENQRMAFEAEQTRKKAMEEAERERIKSMRQGKAVAEQVKVTNVVRVVERQVNPLAISETDLPARTKKALADNGFTSLDQLKGKKKSDLIALKGVGEKAASDIMELLK
ncbi:30S ribosomal protein S2 [bacterium]|nr:30S ribosomal protein S2 [bacterium]